MSVSQQHPPDRNVRDRRIRLDRGMDPYPAPRRRRAALHGARPSEAVRLFGGMGGTPEPPCTLVSQMGLAGVLETFGGLLLVLGLLTRPVALIRPARCSWRSSRLTCPAAGSPLQNGGELPLLYMLIFLFLVGHGAGPVSLDARRQRP